MPPKETPSARETLTVHEVQQLLGIGKNAAYRFVRQNNLVIANGNRLLIPRVRLQKFLDGEQ